VLSERKFKLENYSDYYYGGVVRNLEGLVHIFEKFFHADEEGWYEKMLKKVKLRHLKECQDFLKKYGPLSQIEVMQKVYRVINPFLNHDFDSEKFIEDTIFNSTEVYTAKSDSGFCIKDSIIFEWKRIIDGDSKIECYLKRDIFSDSYVITINDKENKKEIVHNIYREINKEEIVLRLTNNYHDGITLVRYPEGMICYKKWHKSEKPRLLNEEEQKGFEDLIISNFIKKE
jgi:antitoxin component YwqK of YwqJK toxin-antitoxin module